LHWLSRSEQLFALLLQLTGVSTRPENALE